MDIQNHFTFGTNFDLLGFGYSWIFLWGITLCFPWWGLLDLYFLREIHIPSKLEYIRTEQVRQKWKKWESHRNSLWQKIVSSKNWAEPWYPSILGYRCNPWKILEFNKPKIQKFENPLTSPNNPSYVSVEIISSPGTIIPSTSSSYPPLTQDNQTIYHQKQPPTYFLGLPGHINISSRVKNNQ